jgi:lipoprotein signal peptidase
VSAEDAPAAAEAPITRAYARREEVVTIGAVFAADQLTKLAVRRSLPLYDSVNIIPGFLDLTHVQNTGAAFGILNAADFPYKPAVMIGIAAIAVAAITAGAVLVLLDMIGLGRQHASHTV